MDGGGPSTGSFLEGAGNSLVKAFGNEVANPPGDDLAGCYPGDRAGGRARRLGANRRTRTTCLQFLILPAVHRLLYTAAGVVHNCNTMARLYRLVCVILMRRFSDRLFGREVPTTSDSPMLSRANLRFRLAICLLSVSALISGCAGGYYVDPAGYVTNRSATSKRIVASERGSAQAVQRSRTRSVEAARPKAPDTVETVATTGRGDELRPWPKRGTPELEKLQAEEAERERRIEQLLRRGVCTGC